MILSSGELPLNYQVNSSLICLSMDVPSLSTLCFGDNSFNSIEAFSLASLLFSYYSSLGFDHFYSFTVGNSALTNVRTLQLSSIITSLSIMK